MTDEAPVALEAAGFAIASLPKLEETDGRLRRFERVPLFL